MSNFPVFCHLALFLPAHLSISLRSLKATPVICSSFSPKWSSGGLGRHVFHFNIQGVFASFHSCEVLDITSHFFPHLSIVFDILFVHPTGCCGHSSFARLAKRSCFYRLSFAQDECRHVRERVDNQVNRGYASQNNISSDITQNVVIYKLLLTLPGFALSGSDLMIELDDDQFQNRSDTSANHSGRQSGLVQEETLVVFYTRMPRETVRTTRDEVEIRKKFSPRASILFSTESEETD